MASIGLFYGTSQGHTRRVAELIQEAFECDGVDLHDISNAEARDLEDYDLLILGVSTYEHGVLQEHWDDFLWELQETDLHGKQVALFGLGNQVDYPQNFLDGMGTLYEAVRGLGGEVIGRWPTEGYTFKRSAAAVNDGFVGLAVDEENQPGLTEARVAQWVDQLRRELA